MTQPPATAFFDQLDESRFRATAATSGPWDPSAQHGGPPAALLARAVERCRPRDEFRLARITCEILGPVPVAELAVQASVARPGRSVELVVAELTAGGRSVVRAAGWRVRATPDDLPDTAQAAGGDGFAVPDLPPEQADWDAAAEHPSGGGWHADGYLAAVEFRFTTGHWSRPGPATAWTRARVPLVAGEDISPVQRTMLVADVGNGISNTLDIGTWWFINPELTVHLFRPPAGEWVGVAARTDLAPGGAALASSELFDREGRIGRGAQALYVAPR